MHNTIEGGITQYILSVGQTDLSDESICIYLFRAGATTLFLILLRWHLINMYELFELYELCTVNVDILSLVKPLIIVTITRRDV